MKMTTPNLPQPLWRSARSVALATIAALSANSVWAVDATWTNTDGDFLWSNSANWSASPPPTGGNTAFFDAAGAGTILGTTGSISRITFNATAGAYVLGNSSETISLTTLSSGGLITMTVGAANQTIGANLLLLGNPDAAGSGTYNFGNAAATAGQLTITGNVTGGTGGTGGLKSVILSGGGGSVAGDITAGGGTGIWITHNTASAWTLSGDNVFGGGTTATVDGVGYTQAYLMSAAGTLNVGSNTALSGTGMSVSLLNNVIRFTSAGATIQAVGGARTISNTLLPVSNNITNIAGSNDLTFTGRLQANGGGISLIVNNTGLTTFDGDVAMRESGSGVRSLQFGGSGDVVVNGTLTNGAGAGAHTLGYQGTGTLTLTKTSAFTGTTTVAGGGRVILDFSASAPASILPGSNLTLGSNTNGTTNGILPRVAGGNVELKGSPGGTTTQSVGTVTFGTGTANSIRFVQNGATGLSLAMAGLTRNAGSTLDVTLPTTGTLTTSTTTSSGTNQVNGNGVAYSTVGGTTWLTNTSGTLGALSDGSYQVDSVASSIGDTDVQSDYTPGAVFTANTVRFNSAGKTLTLDAAGTSTLTAGGILVTSAGSGSKISGTGSAALRSGTTGDAVVIHDYADLAIEVPIVNNDPTSLTKTGTGTTTLSGANTYSGLTYITAGTLKFATQVSLYNNVTANWTAANILVGAGATAAFNVGGAGEFTSGDIDTIKALGSANNNGFTPGASLGLDTANAAGGNFTYSSAIGNTFGGANALGLQKLGANKLTLDNTSTYTGATVVKGGTLAVTGTGSINDTSGVTVQSGATFAYASSVDLNREVTLQNGSTLGGTNWNGTLGGLTIGAGVTISPGMSPGNADTPSQTWASGGTYVFEIDDATGTVSSNWDHLTVAGALTLDSSLLSTPFVIQLTSLDLPVADASPGLLDNFNPASNYQWDFATVGSFEGSAFASGMFSVDASAFANPLAGGSFSVVQNSANTLAIQFTAIPEPTTALLVLGGLAASAFRRRRRR